VAKIGFCIYYENIIPNLNPEFVVEILVMLEIKKGNAYLLAPPRIEPMLIFCP
jgi:hypothetical protein